MRQTEASSDSNQFAGFPTSGLATVVPNSFFSSVLPKMETSEELVVSVYFFFAQNLKRRRPRYVTRSELEGDRALARSLARLCGGQTDALERGLDLAVERGTVVRATAAAGAELYAVNTPANRRELSALQASGFVLDESPPPADGSDAPNIFALYEANIGGITPLLAEDLKEAEEQYPWDWIRDAVHEAVSLNKRSWRYIERILRRWEVEGRDDAKPERDPEVEWLERRYREGRKRRGARSGA